MDARPLYPEGFHPAVPTLNKTATEPAKVLRRCNVEGVIYYVTDFGISTSFDNPDEPRLVHGVDCQDKEVPELSQWTPYDPFPVDIFTLGNVFKNELLAAYANLSFFEPLVFAMTTRKPEERPTIAKATEMFQQLVRTRKPYQLRWRLQFAQSSRVTRLKTSLNSIIREWNYYWSSRKTKHKTPKR